MFNNYNNKIIKINNYHNKYKFYKNNIVMHKNN